MTTAIHENAFSNLPLLQKDHNLLNNQSKQNRIPKNTILKKKLIKFEKLFYHTQTGNKIEREIPKQF